MEEEGGADESARKGGEEEVRWSAELEEAGLADEKLTLLLVTSKLFCLVSTNVEPIIEHPQTCRAFEREGQLRPSPLAHTTHPVVPYSRT